MYGSPNRPICKEKKSQKAFSYYLPNTPFQKVTSANIDIASSCRNKETWEMLFILVKCIKCFEKQAFWGKLGWANK